MSTAAGRDHTIERYRREPQLGADALFLEHVARSINPSQTLITGSSAADLAASAGLSEVLRRFETKINTCDWSLYEVRRVVRPGKDGARGMVARSVHVRATGGRDAMIDQLVAAPGRRVQGADGMVRHVLRERGNGGRTDHWFVAAPSGAESKQRGGFEQWWQEATGDALF